MEVKCIPIGKAKIMQYQGGTHRLFTLHGNDRYNKEILESKLEGYSCLGTCKTKANNREMTYHIYKYTLQHTDLIPEYTSINVKKCPYCEHTYDHYKKSVAVEDEHAHNHIKNCHPQEYVNCLNIVTGKKFMLYKKPYLLNGVVYPMVKCYCGKKIRLSQIIQHIGSHLKHSFKKTYQYLLRKNLIDSWPYVKRDVITGYIKPETLEVALPTYKIVAVRNCCNKEILVDSIELLDEITRCRTWRELNDHVNTSRERLNQVMCDFEVMVQKTTDEYLGTPKEPIVIDGVIPCENLA